MNEERRALDDAKYRWVRGTLVYADEYGDIEVAWIWTDCEGKWWARLGCGCVLRASGKNDAMGWVWDRREHGH